jgi:hypothetical protein
MVSFVSGILAGVGAGVAATVLMGIVSEACYRAGFFKSSLLIIDGSFLLKFLGKETGKGQYLAGIPIHLLTGAVFGATYMTGTNVFGLNPFSPGLVTLYFFLLWLSMLFIALPIAGQGIMGRKASTHTWFEQLVLHVVFGVGYYYSLLALA